MLMIEPLNTLGECEFCEMTKFVVATVFYDASDMLPRCPYRSYLVGRELIKFLELDSLDEQRLLNLYCDYMVETCGDSWETVMIEKYGVDWLSYLETKRRQTYLSIDWRHEDYFVHWKRAMREKHGSDWETRLSEILNVRISRI